MKALAPFAIVLRFSGFRLSQTDLEARLGVTVERYSLDKGGYAQISIEGDEPEWGAVNDLLQRLGSAVKTLRDDGEVQSACLDVAWNFREGAVLTSYVIPARTAALAGSHGIDVEFSAHLAP